jgi:hypothetical protein
MEPWKSKQSLDNTGERKLDCESGEIRGMHQISKIIEKEF